jgi:hypothetical protein
MQAALRTWLAAQGAQLPVPRIAAASARPAPPLTFDAD